MEENNKKNNEMQSRRAFFKKAVKNVLPFVAGVVLASTPNLAKANTGEEVSGCDYGCMYGCMGLCSRACSTTCVAAAVEDVVAHVHTLVRTPVKAVAWEAATQDVAA